MTMNRFVTRYGTYSSRLGSWRGALDPRKNSSNPICILGLRVFITAYGDASMRIQAMREGAVEFLAKPFDHQLMLKTVRAALDL